MLRSFGRSEKETAIVSCSCLLYGRHNLETIQVDGPTESLTFLFHCLVSSSCNPYSATSKSPPQDIGKMAQDYNIWQQKTPLSGRPFGIVELAKRAQQIPPSVFCPKGWRHCSDTHTLRWSRPGQWSWGLEVWPMRWIPQ